MGLYSKDEEPAQDLARFIERGYVGVKDTEVSLSQMKMATTWYLLKLIKIKKQ